MWVAVALVVVAVVIEFVLAGPSTPLGWVAFGLIAVALVVLIVSLVGVAVGVIRGFADGWRSNRSRSVQPPPSRPEAQVRSEPTPDDEGSAPAAPAGDPPLPRPAVPDSVKNLAAAAQAKAPTRQDVDRTARALGRAAGAARRAYRKDD